jgi:hypothetical protein
VRLEQNVGVCTFIPRKHNLLRLLTAGIAKQWYLSSTGRLLIYIYIYIYIYKMSDVGLLTKPNIVTW